MNICIIDISGRVEDYDYSLFEAIRTVRSSDSVKLLIPKPATSKKKEGILGLLRLVPTKLKTSESFFKRILKTIELLCNYVFLLFFMWAKKPDVIHLQWLPLLEVCSLEIPILRLLRSLAPQTKVFYTVHNLYPHGYNDYKRVAYKKRFLQVSTLIDSFIVHTEVSKKEISCEYQIENNKIEVIHHGVFVPDLTGINQKDYKKAGKTKLIVYGNQDSYKGTDIVIDALNYLPQYFKNRVSLSIIGRVQDNYLRQLKEKEGELDITWKPYYVENNVLYQDIVESDIILLPYRTITQSGVLLLALYFNKPIICSDLPAFKETLAGYPKELFFKAGDPFSLKDVLINVLDNKITLDYLPSLLKSLRDKYSWENAAKMSLTAYHKLNRGLL